MGKRPGKAGILRILLWHHFLYFWRKKSRLIVAVGLPTFFLILFAVPAIYFSHWIDSQPEQKLADHERVNYKGKEADVPFSNVNWTTMIDEVDRPITGTRLGVNALDETICDLPPSLDDDPNLCVRFMVCYMKHQQLEHPSRGKKKTYHLVKQFLGIFGRIVYYPKTNATKEVAATIEHLLNNRSRLAQKLAAEAPNATSYDGNGLMACFNKATIGFDDFRSAKRFVANAVKTEGYTKDGKAFGWETAHPLILGVVDLTNVETGGYSIWKKTPPSRFTNITHVTQVLQIKLQLLLDDAIPGRGSSIRVHRFQIYEVEKCSKNLKGEALAFTFALMMILLLYVVFPAVPLEVAKAMALEKKGGIRSYLQLVGVTGSMVTFSWFIYGFILTTIFVIAGTAVMKLSFMDVSALYLLLFFVLHVVAQNTFIALLTACLSRVVKDVEAPYSVVTLVTFLAAFITALSMSSLNGATLIAVRILCLSFAAPSLLAIVYMYKWIFENEMDFVSVAASGLYVGDDFGGIHACLLHLVFDIVLYALLAVFAEWLQECTFKRPRKVKANNDQTLGTEMEGLGSTGGSIALRNVSKHYGKVKALGDVSVVFPAGRITAFLGENGAGKTTAANIMIGFAEPTTGLVEYDGLEFRANRAKLLPELAYVPQENILYDHLTLADHLKFYGYLKGIPSTAVLPKSLYDLQCCDLYHVLNVIGTRLSGGQKRKLSILIAYLGDPKYVILDEPTAGVDPSSAKAIWDIILRNKERATTIISTHRIEDADVLADNVVVINQGTLVTEGTPNHLKEKYDLGSRLIVDTAKLSRTQSDDLCEFVGQKLEIAEDRVSKSQNSIICRVPKDVESSGKFIACLKELEEKHACSYGVTEASLNDVYFAALEEKIAPGATAELPMLSKFSNEKRRKPSAAKKIQQSWRQITALCRRRFQYHRSNVFSTAHRLLSPVILVLLLVAFLSTLHGLAKVPLEARRTYRTNQYVYRKGHKDCPAVNRTLFSPLRSVAKPPNPNGRCENDSPLKTVSDGPGQVTTTEKEDVMNMSTLIADLSHFRTPVLGGLDCSSPTQSVLMLNADGAEEVVAALGNKFGEQSLLYKVENVYPQRDQLQTILIHGATAFFLATSFANAFKIARLFVEEDIRSGNKHLLELTNVPPALYWLVNFLWDVGMGLVAALSTCAVVHTLLTLHFEEVAGVLILSMIMATAYTNCVFALLGADIGSVLVSVGTHYMTSVGGLVVTLLRLAVKIASALSMPEDAGDDDEGKGSQSPMWILLKTLQVGTTVVGYIASALFPAFAVGEGLTLVTAKSMFEDIFPSLPKHIKITDMIETNYKFMGVHIIAALVLLLLKESLGLKLSLARMICSRKGGTRITMDQDVALEEELARSAIQDSIRKAANVPPIMVRLRRSLARLIRSRNPTASVILHGDEALEEDTVPPLMVCGIQKRYGMSVPPAVNSVSFRAMKGECFGLLGVNGAGKTTVFRILTGEAVPDLGECYIQGKPYGLRPKRNYGNIMYCPQENVLCDYLTTYEHITLFADCAGYPSSSTKILAQELMDALDLTQHAHKKTSALSGGNKRKLQLILALVGCPAVALLDEPTAGMDPKVRQRAWNAIGVAKKNATVILSSHSMDDCEALCDRLVIMVAGQFNCIGSIQYLKDKLGNRYVLKLKTNLDNHQKTTELILAGTNSRAVLIDVAGEWLKYEIDSTDLPKLSLLYELFAQARETCGVESHVASQITLQDVFLRMAKRAESEQGATT